MKSIVAIVGRPNVGKSTLFNRLIGKRKAIVDDISGITRDRLYDFGTWNGKEFIIVDTGGYVSYSDDIFEKEIKKQVEFAIEEASVILFIVDVTVGITDLDDSFAKYLIKVKKPIFIVVNKTDSFDKISLSYEFYKYGYDIFPVSAITGMGTGELLDKIVDVISTEKEDFTSESAELPKFAIIGKPNVGKSTLINTLLGEERNIVSEQPGTTRDSIHSTYNKYGKQFILIDTAGLRKKNKIYNDIEHYSVIRAINAIEESDVCLVILDAKDNIQSQDINIIDLAIKRNKGILILINKWDLVEKDSNTEKNYIKELKEKLAPFNDVPVVTISALNKTRIFKVLEKAFSVFENKQKKIATSILNDKLLKVIENYHPPSTRNRLIKIKYITQMKASIPLFAFFCNYPEDIKTPYKRYLENKIRELFCFEGVPIKIVFKKK